MKEVWNSIQMVFTIVGGWLGWFLGGCDGLVYALVLGPGEISQNGSGENHQKLVKKKSPMYQKIDENYLLV